MGNSRTEKQKRFYPVYGLLLLLLGLLVPEVTAQQAPSEKAVKALIPTPSRKWIGQEGGSALGIITTIDAAADTVSMRMADGKTGTNYPISNFSEADQAYLRDASKGFLRGKVVGVHDGDSLTLLVAGNTQFKIRLEAIDTPELGQEFGNNAKQGLAKMVFGKQVKVTITGKDRYKRFLGFVEIDGTNVNHEMVVRGLAWHYKEYSKDTKLAASETAARKAKIGLWSAFNPMAPWDYRKLKRTGVAKTSTGFDPFKTTTKPSSTTGTTKHMAEASFWLNTSSNTRHNSRCRWHGNTKRGRYVTKSEGRACGTCGG